MVEQLGAELLQRLQRASHAGRSPRWGLKHTLKHTLKHKLKHTLTHLHIALHHAAFQPHQLRVFCLKRVDEGLELGVLAAEAREPHAVLGLVVVVQRLVHAGEGGNVNRTCSL